MSSTRHAPEGAPFRQDRYASSPAYNIGLNAYLVAKRCELLDAAVARLIWFLQFRSLPPRDGAGGRIGGMGRIASEFLPYLASIPEISRPRVEEWSDADCVTAGRPMTDDELAAEKRAEAAALAQNLAEWSLDPCFTARGSPNRRWFQPLERYREDCSNRAKAKLADTSISSVVWDALKFTRDTSEASLIIGEPRLGKSETAKVFCEGQCGLARYVEVPSTNDERSLYKAVAEALGVADGTAYKAAQIRDRIEEVLRRSKIMLVLDEAQNLWPQRMRPQSAPIRVLWINSLINMGVPISLVALPEFMTWMRICADKTGWSPRQIEQRITIHRRLPDALTQEDFQTLAAHLAPSLSPAAIMYLVGCALSQDGAAFVKKVLSAATYRAGKAGRPQATFDDIKAAVSEDIMPSATSLRDALAAKPAPRGRPLKAMPASLPPTPAPIRSGISTTPALPVQRARTGAAVPSHAEA